MCWNDYAEVNRDNAFKEAETQISIESRISSDWLSNNIITVLHAFYYYSFFHWIISKVLYIFSFA